MSLRNEAVLTPQIKTHCRHALRTHVRVHKPCTRQHYTSTPRRLSKVTVSTDCNRTNDHQNPSYHNHSSGMQRQHVTVGPSAGPKFRAFIRAQIMNHNVGTTRWERTVRSQRVGPTLWFNLWGLFFGTTIASARRPPDIPQCSISLSSRAQCPVLVACFLRAEYPSLQHDATLYPVRAWLVGYTRA